MSTVWTPARYGGGCKANFGRLITCEIDWTKEGFRVSFNCGVVLKARYQDLNGACNAAVSFVRTELQSTLMKL